ncbi:MAG TPA: alpha/beta hydrolase [Chloroflexota bacterium]|nr:alpha/beta hydrolase [Chloroflexota bacterium]HZU07925.1 alpha/beta hydrolase [Chloroflexota bacterium]
MQERFLDVRGTRVQLLEDGTGDPLLFLHGAGGGGWTPGLALLAERFHVYAPNHPGFGESDVREDWDTIDDFVYHYLDFLDVLGLDRVHLVGASLGGWLAAELAVGHSHRLRSLVLLSAAGLWVDEAPMADLFILSPEELQRLTWHDPSRAPAPPPSTPETMIAQARARATVARLAWNPYFHNPKLPGRLGRIRVPTLILWGESDRLIPLEHGRRYQQLIPGAVLETIPECGHVILREQPERGARLIIDFITSRGL